MALGSAHPALVPPAHFPLALGAYTETHPIRIRECRRTCKMLSRLTSCLACSSFTILTLSLVHLGSHPLSTSCSIAHSTNIMFNPILLSFSLLPLLPRHFQIVCPMVSQNWDVAIDQVISWNFNSSDPANVSLWLHNSLWDLDIGIDPNVTLSSFHCQVDD